jgi:hypothetical protein
MSATFGNGKGQGIFEKMALKITEKLPAKASTTFH